MDFNKHDEVSTCSFSQLLRHSSLGIQTINITKCPSNIASQARINCCIYPDLKITLTFTLTLLDIDRKCLDVKGHFVLDVEIGCVANCVYFLT